MRKRRKLYSGLIVAGATVVGCGVGFFLSDEAPTHAINNQSFSVEEYGIETLQVEGFVPLPSELRGGEIEFLVDTNSVKTVLKDTYSETFLAQSQEGKLCLIIFLQHEEWTASASCTDPEPFKENGLALRTTGVVGHKEVYVVSDSMRQLLNLDSSLVSEGDVVSNVFEIDPFMNEFERSELSSANPMLQVMPVISDD